MGGYGEEGRGMRTEFVESADGTRIAFERVGEGPALVLVDGAAMHRAFGTSRGLAQLLSPSFTVVSYDRRGRGESADTSPWALEREVEDRSEERRVGKECRSRWSP